MMKKAAIKKYTKLEKERRKEEKRIGERDRERPKRVSRDEEGNTYGAQ